MQQQTLAQTRVLLPVVVLPDSTKFNDSYIIKNHSLTVYFCCIHLCCVMLTHFVAAQHNNCRNLVLGFHLFLGILSEDWYCKISAGIKASMYGNFKNKK